MKRLWLMAAAFSAAAGVAPAQAFHPSEQTYGYVATKKVARSVESGDVLYYAAKPSKKKKSQNFSMFDDKPKKYKKGPKTLSGGGKPGISAVAPQTVAFSGYSAGTIVIDTAGRKLYLVRPGGQAFRYPVAVGRAGFTWSGTKSISRKVSWPDWRPPAEMLARKPHLPEFMEGGIRNPLGAKALYLGSSLYRIHGTNETKSIGTAASSGCFRMTNGHVTHLAGMVGVGTKVVVLKSLGGKYAKASSKSKAKQS
jgi:lipoprotein-anchoring transpeptidase ErfK/SrfK